MRGHETAAGDGAAAAAQPAATLPGAAPSAAAAVTAARERLLQAGMRSGGWLHPAFERPDGHYRALKDMADALVSCELWACVFVLAGEGRRVCERGRAGAGVR